MSIEHQAPTQVDGQDLRAALAERLLGKVGQRQASPLSSAQQRLWFLDQLEPNSPLYNIPSVARLRGNLSVTSLQAAINAIVARHETLRTRFVSEDGEPSVVVDEEVTIQLEHHDLSHVPAQEREQAARRLVDQEVKRPFNLGDDRLLRVALLQLAPGDCLLLINMHHIVSDEWSFKLFYSELAHFYAALMAGERPFLPELPIQYSDYAAWQQGWLKSEPFEKHITFWKEQLKGNPPAIELPTDHPRPSRGSSRGGVLTHPLGPELSQALRHLAQSEGSTLFMVLLAAFKTLLFRYTQQQDIIVGSPMAGRNRVETESLIGFFVNTLPLRTQVSGDMTFSGLLAEVREVALAAYCHQELPFEKLVEVLQPERSQGTTTPFINVMFLTQTDMEETCLQGVQIEFLDVVTNTSKFDLSLGVQELGDKLITGVEYNTDLFEASTIARFLQHYECLLQGIVAQPKQTLAELPLLSEVERCQMLGEWSPSPISLPHGECVHQWFEAQAASTPDAIALTFGQDALTYGELNARANRLASYLRDLGVGPEIPVALHLERTPAMFVSILAVLKAGGAYLPIDPSCPAERLQFMLVDTKAPIILSQSNLAGQLPSIDARIICVDSDSAIDTYPAANPASGASGRNIAYIIYTSGSTGEPKGVLVTHANVVRLMKQTEHWYGFNSSDVWTQFHSYTFDFSVWEIWGALLYGGRLVIVPYLVSRSPAEFYELLAREKVTVLNQTPSAFRQLIWAEETAPAPLPLSLRYVIFGGEALELQSLKSWFERHGDEKPMLVNMYGITETTVHVTYRVIRMSDLGQGFGSVIGVPIPDLKIYLLDEKQQPVPAGVPGEICVAGLGVARGYLNRPELTAQRFMPDPFSRQAGLRLYRSGDLGRYVANGELEYLGRMDHQVKIRGFRVELGEIESALASHPGIRESVVLASDGAGGSKRLVAYIVPTATTPTLAELRRHLLQKIPEYMVPSAFVPMDALPLTSNGKVNRRDLPAADDHQTATGQTYVAPRNPTETTLMEIWCQLLRRNSISIHENFFHLGGHSLLATQAIWRIAGAFSVDLPVRSIFEAPTIAELAEVVSRARPGKSLLINRRDKAATGADVLSRLDQLSDAELKELLKSV